MSGAGTSSAIEITSQSAIGDDGTIYVAGKEPGIMAVNETETVKLDATHGAPAEQVQALAWLDGRLYAAFKNNFTVFDPKTKRFEILSSYSAGPLSRPIDGDGSFFIFELVADRENHCLWFDLQDNTGRRSRNGVWRYKPETKEFKHVQHAFTGPVLSESLLLVPNRNEEGWSEIDRATGQLKPLVGYDPSKSLPHGIAGPPRFLRFGDRLIDNSGQLFTSDGHVARLELEVPWDFLQHAGDGFLTHFEHRKSTLWYVKPRT